MNLSSLHSVILMLAAQDYNQCMPWLDFDAAGKPLNTLHVHLCGLSNRAVLIVKQIGNCINDIPPDLRRYSTSRIVSSSAPRPKATVVRAMLAWRVCHCYPSKDSSSPPLSNPDGLWIVAQRVFRDLPSSPPAPDIQSHVLLPG